MRPKHAAVSTAPRSRFSARGFGVALTLAALGLAFAAPAAVADQLQNTLVSPATAYTFPAGGSIGVNFWEHATPTCDATTASPNKFTLNLPSGLTASASSFTLSGCEAVNGQTITFSATSPGSYNVTETSTDGSVSTNASKITFIVTAPVDSTPPVITPTIVGTLGNNGWYTSDVSLSWSVTDAQSTVTSSSGCGAVTLTAETSGQTYTCTATSAGGTNAVSRTIKIDKTGPTNVVISPSGTAGNNEWFTSNVVATTSGSETLSTPITCTADQNLTAETTGQTVSGSCTNAAGLTTNASPISVKIDKTAPTNVVSTPAGTAGSNGWFTSDVTVTTKGTDAISGVTCTGPVPVTGNTAGTVVHGSCTNGAGLASSAADLTVMIDKTNPTASLSVTKGTLGNNDWYTDDVTVSTTGGDDVSGPVSCTADQQLTTDTTVAGQNFDGSCTNGAGLTQDATTLNVKRDASPPTARLEVTNNPTVGAHDWYTSAVTVATQGADPQSGVTCSGGGSVATDTASITFTGYCVNGAGLRTDAAPLTIKVDTTGPTASLGVIAGTAGANGWYTSDVTVRTSGNDATSGPVTCTADQHQTTETAGQVFNGTCTNDAGLSTDATPLNVMLDKTGPTNVVSTVTSGTAGANDWYTSSVVVSTTGDEDVSGPAECTSDRTLTDETTGTNAAGQCTNQAGLTAHAADLVVKIDTTAPSATITPSGTLGQNGWYTSAVTLSTTGSDSISDPTTCTAPQTQSADTTGASFSGTCTNDAGLQNGANVTVKVDQTAPVVTLNGVTDGGTYTLGSPKPSCATNDATSGVQTPASLTISGGPVGTITATCSGALDNAGNSGKASATYTVHYAFSGFLAPINNPQTVNTGKAGRTYPVKWQLKDANGNYISSLSAVSLSYKSVTCGTFNSDSTDGLETTATGGTVLRYDTTANQYVYNWASPSAGCYTLFLKLDDGTSWPAYFNLSK